MTQDLYRSLLVGPQIVLCAIGATIALAVLGGLFVFMLLADFKGGTRGRWRAPRDTEPKS